MKLKQIADRIYLHLQRIEYDKTLNPTRGDAKGGFWNSSCYASGRYVCVCYVSYQGSSSLSKQEAVDYLAYLDAGGTETHFTQQDESRDQH